MADDKRKTGPADRGRININEDYEVRGAKSSGSRISSYSKPSRRRATGWRMWSST